MYELLAHPAVVGPAVVILVLTIIYRAPRGLSLLLAVIVGICTKDKDRRDACVEMVYALCQTRFHRSQSSAQPIRPRKRRPRSAGTTNTPPSLPKP